MKKILYFMHVPWGLIKQRPHFLAEKLADLYKVDVYYKIQMLNKGELKDNPIPEGTNMRANGYDIIPFDKIPLFKWLPTDFLNRLYVRRYLPKFKCYDYIWVSSPYTYRFIHHLIPSECKVIYDCMDDYPEFPDLPQNRRDSMVTWEKRLIERSDYIICSSEYLKEKILKRAESNKNAIVVNNAVEIPEQENIELPSHVVNMVKQVDQLSKPLIYIGKVSEWFDFDSMRELLDQYEDLNLVLFGPKDIEIPVHSRIHYMGVVERKYIFKLMEKAYALVMPFKLNELILSVNPVKAYEYISTGKPVILRAYRETQKFKDYALLYNDIKELFACIEKIENMTCDEPYLNKCKAYVKKNTWTDRVKDIISYLGD